MGYTPGQRARILGIIGPQQRSSVRTLTDAERKRRVTQIRAADRIDRVEAMARARREIVRCLASPEVRRQNAEARELARAIAWRNRGRVYSPSAHARIQIEEGRNDDAVIRTATGLRWSSGTPVATRSPSLSTRKSADSRTMVINFSPFGTWYVIDSLREGTFLESTARGAFGDTMVQDRARIKSQFDHGHDPYIGSKPLGRVTKLEETAYSPRGEVELLDATYVRDIAAGLSAGVYGSSFRFAVEVDEWTKYPKKSAYNPQGLPERVIRKVRLYEFGPVTNPANPHATATVRGRNA